MKALKLFHEFDLIGIFIPEKYAKTYVNKKSEFDNHVFNMFLITHYLRIESNFVFLEKEERYLIKNIYHLPFDDVSNYLDSDDYRNINFFVSAAYRFCKNNDCKKDLFKEIEMSKLKSIIF